MIEHRFYLSFLDWFKDSGVDFWSECDAPEQLAKLANDLFQEMMSPITKAFLKNATREEYDAAYREYLNNSK